MKALCIVSCCPWCEGLEARLLDFAFLVIYLAGLAAIFSEALGVGYFFKLDCSLIYFRPPCNPPLSLGRLEAQGVGYFTLDLS